MGLGAMAADTLPPPAGHVLGSVAVIGAGFGGLAAAYRLRAKGIPVKVFEAQEVIGGKANSVSDDGLVWEKGPNTMAETDPLVGRLIDELQLRQKQQFPVLQNKRYVVRDGKAQMLPSNPIALLGSKLLSTRAKLNIMLEPLFWKRKDCVDEGELRDESVSHFMERHFGREVVDYLINPFVAGTSAAEPDDISVRHTFPDLVLLEEKYGSIILGAVKAGIDKSRSRKQTEPERVWDENSTITSTHKHGRGSFSFVGGLQTLAKALGSKIGEGAFELRAPIVSLTGNQQGNPGRESWQLSYGKGCERQADRFDAVILTTPLDDFKKIQLAKDGKPYSIDFIPKVVYQPVSVLVTAFHKEDVKQPLDGFGVLVPSKEQANGFHTLGTLFSSAMFPDRAPPNLVCFTTFIGGSRNRQLATRPPDELQQVVVQDLSRLVGVANDPVSIRHFYWEKAFPEYSVGYGAVVDALAKVETDLPGVFFAGNMRDGLAVGKALVSGYKAAERVIAHLEGSGGRKIYTMASAPGS